MDDLLREIQLTELEILKVFHDVCMRNGIKYSLHGGTLLGAVRHKGFIPWDDDVDVFMERPEFDRFVEAWEREDPEGYFLQTKDKEPAYTRSFAKIRKEGTTFLQGIEDPEKIHTGIFIDIMPFDRLPAKHLDRTRFYWAAIRYEVLCREFIPKNMNPLIKTVCRSILQFNAPEKRAGKRKKLLDIIRRHDMERTLPLIMVETIKTLRTPLPAELFDDFVFMDFEGESLMCTAVWDRFLTVWLGDYMTLPPESERVWAHHPVKIDLKHSYNGITKNDN